MVEPIEVAVLLAVVVLFWVLFSSKAKQVTTIQGLQREVRTLLEKRLTEFGAYAYDMYYFYENGEAKILDTKVSLVSFPRTEEALPGYTSCYGRERPRRLVKLKKDPDFVLEKSLNNDILKMAEFLILSRQRTRIIIGFHDCQTTVSVSE